MRSIHVYKQHSMETCGISCIMMVLDSFGIERPSPRKEHILYQAHGAKSTRGTLGGAIARVLSNRGLAVTLVHESKELMENRDGYFSAQEHQAVLAEHREQIAMGSFDVEAGVSIDSARLRSELSAGRLVIVHTLIEGNADGVHDHVTHWILLYGTAGDDFLACDPLPWGGKMTLTQAQLEQYMNTPFGRCIIVAGAKA